MRDKKKILRFLYFIVPLSLLAAVAFYLLDVFVCTEIYQIFWSLCLNIFAGASVLLVTTTIEYNKNKRDVLEKLYIEFSLFCDIIFSLNPITDETGEKTIKEIDKYYALACQSFKEMDWAYGQLYLRDDDELFKCCRSLYGYKVDFYISLMEFKSRYEEAPIEMKIYYLQDIQYLLFDVRVEENEDSIVTYYESKVISHMDLLLKEMLNRTYKRKNVEYKERTDWNKKGCVVKYKNNPH